MNYLAMSLVCIIVLLGAGCRSGSEVTKPQSGRLPDHITVVHSGTLPQALLQARQDGKALVHVSDPRGQFVEVSVDSPTSTQVRYSTYAEAKGDVYAALESRGVDTSKFYNRALSTDNTQGSFSTNIVNYQEVAVLIYELAIGYQAISSTSAWTIDLLPTR